MKVDIVVAGGGIAGAMAAVAAGRTGKKVLLIEETACLGGMLTSAGVGPMMTFHSGDRQMIGGLTAELIERLKTKGGSVGHIVDTIGYTSTLTPFDAEAMKLELDLMCEEAGVTILFHSRVIAAKIAGDRISSVTVSTPGGVIEIAGEAFIDATGDADLAVMSGVPTDKGRPEDGKMQPLTMNLKVYNVDIPKIRAYIKSHPEEFPMQQDKVELLDLSPRLAVAGFVPAIRQAIADGRLSFKRECLLFFETVNPGEVIINTSRLIGVDPTDPVALSEAERTGRKQAAELMKFLRESIPGFEQAVLAFSGPRIGVRSSLQIKGLATLKVSDIVNAVKYPDAVVCYSYPIDIHSPSGKLEENYSYHLKPGEYYTIPYGALLNAKIANLAVAGRSISSEFGAQAAFRTTPCVGAIGQAAGAAAALALEKGGDFAKVEYPKLKKILLEQDAYLF
ncbi:MAG: FAD-dependent oxidoreductase [Victivallaceae bacterium]